MANPDHVVILRQGVEVWNRWREQNPEVQPDLSGESQVDADLVRANLSRANLQEMLFYEAELEGADFSQSNLTKSNFTKADLFKAEFEGTVLIEADFSEAQLSEAHFSNANLSWARMRESILRETNLENADLSYVNLIRADLSGASLRGANLKRAILRNAIFFQSDMCDSDLTEADLTATSLVETNLAGANLTNCRVYGVSVWDVKLEGTVQSNLIITPSNASTITVDNFEVAQFVYLLLNNEKIRDVIDTVARKVVLILGRFTPERKVVLDAIRDELRKRDYLPILFDFDKPAARNITETVRTLAHLSRFIIADLTDPSSIPQELYAIIPTLAVPIQPVLERGNRAYSMFVDLRTTYHWVLPIHEYQDTSDLLASLGSAVISPAEAKAKELERR